MVFAVAIVVIWMLYDSTFCSYFSDTQPAHRFQLPSSVQERFEPSLASCSLNVFCSWLCVSQLSAPKGSSYLGMGTVAQAGSARAGAPWRAVQSCPSVGSAAGSSAHAALPGALGMAPGAQPAVHGDNPPVLSLAPPTDESGTNLEPLPPSLL